MFRLKTLIFYAIIPALVAGLFSIAPKLYDIASEPSAKLTYTLTTGPELETEGQHRRITSIRVFNSGKKPLHHVQTEITLLMGHFEAFRVLDSSGLRPNTRESQTDISTEIATFHPTEEFTVVAMELVPDVNTVTQFHLRSDEVLGQQQVTSEGKREPLELIGGILSGISVFVMAFVLTLKKHALFGPEREDLIFYVLLRVGLTEMTEKIRFSNGPLTYMRTADILLDSGLRGDEEYRLNCLKALKCLLLVDTIAASSRKVVEDNIKKLAGKSYSSEELDKIKKSAAPRLSSSNVRERIDTYLSTSQSIAKTQSSYRR